MRIAPLEINTHYKHSSPLWHLNYFIITMRLQMWKAWRFHHRVHPIKVSCFLCRDEKRNNCNFTTRKSKKYRKYFITSWDQNDVLCSTNLYIIPQSDIATNIERQYFSNVFILFMKLNLRLLNHDFVLYNAIVSYLFNQ